MVALYVPERGVARTLALGAAADSVGTGLFQGLLPLYLVLVLDAPAARVGLMLGVAHLVGLLVAVPAGRLVDRGGPGRVWGWLVAVRMLGYACYLAADSFTAFAVLTVILVPVDRASAVAQQAYVVHTFPADRRNPLMAAIRTFRNVGMSVGLLGSGIIVSIGGSPAYHVGLLVNAASYAVFLVTIRRIARAGPAAPAPTPADAEGPPVATGAATPDRRPGPLRDPRYAALTAGETLLLLHDSVLFVFFPLWIVSRTDVPSGLVGPLLAVNTVLTVLLQIPLSRWALGVADARRMVVLAAAPLLATCLLFVLAENAGGVIAVLLVVAGVVALTLGENLHGVGSFELSHRMAPDGAAGRYLGFFGMSNSAQLTLGPPLVTGVVLATPLGWVVLAGAFVCGSGLMRFGSARPPAERLAEQHR